MREKREDKDERVEEKQSERLREMDYVEDGEHSVQNDMSSSYKREEQWADGRMVKYEYEE